MTSCPLGLRSLIRSLVMAIALSLAWPAFAACSVSGTDNDIGNQSSNALRAGAVPYTSADGGFTCSSSSVISLLANNYLRATVAAGTVLVLTAPSGATVPYLLAGMPDGTYQLRPGVATDYVGGNGLTILSLGGGAVNARVYVKPSSATAVTQGVYSGNVDIRWQWRFCSGVYALGACVGDLTQGDVVARVKITLTVAAKPIGIQITTATTWDTVAGSTAPKSLPGSKQRLSVTVSNTDIVALDLNTLAIVLPTMAQSVVALDGDGASSGAAVQSAEGSPASGLTLSYTNPADQGDDVDFSSDGGVTWTYAPVAGDAATQAAVTRVRFRPKGSMAPLSSFTMSIPYSVK